MLLSPVAVQDVLLELGLEAALVGLEVLVHELELRRVSEGVDARAVLVRLPGKHCDKVGR